MPDDAERQNDAGASAEATGPTVALTAPSGVRGAPDVRPALKVIERASYEVRGEIARGGLGRILEAHDHRLDRTVAIKELLAEHLEGKSGLEARFAREAFLTARLQHPAIVPVYEAGLWPDGAPFYTMKLVDGKSLEAAVRERPTLEERLGLIPHVIDVANALAYAHGRRIIHRDLKPANILVGAFGETVVIDWGLAKEIGPAGETLTSSLPPPVAASERPGATQAGSVLGTPAYMPPEQALGESVDERADVYALGAVLYHVLAGVAPYTGKSSADILAQVVREPPEDLLKKEPAVPPELAAVARKALARDPAGRYPTAAELAADLGRYQRGQRVVAHRYGVAAVVVRFLKRHRAALTVAALMLFVLAVVVWSDFRRIVAERDRAESEKAEAQRLRDQADARGDALALREAEALLARDPRKALAWLKHLAPESRLLGAGRILAGDAFARGVPARVLSDTLAGALALSADGKLLAAARADDVLVVDTVSGQTGVLRGRGGPPRALAFAADGSRLAYASADGIVRVWTRAVRAVTDLPGHEGEVTALAFLGPERLGTVGADGTLRIWELGQGVPARVFAAHTGAVIDVAASGSLIATAGSDGSVKLWEPGAASGAQPVATFPSDVVPARVLFSSDGAQLAVVGDDGRVRLWDVEAHRYGIVDGHASRVTAAAQAAGLVATGDASGGIHVVDLAARRTVRLTGHEDDVLALAFAGGGILVSGGRDRTVRVWDARTGRAVRQLLGHDGDVTAVAAAGSMVATAGRDRTVRLWDLAAGEPRIPVVSERPLFALAASDDHRRLAAGGSGSLYVIDAGGRRSLPVRGERVRALALGGTLLGVGFETGAVRVYDGDGQPRELGQLSAAAQALALDGRGKLVAAGGVSGFACYAAADGRKLFGDDGSALALAFAPGGSLLVTAGSQVRLWDVASARPRRLDGGTGPFVTAAFSPDGRHVAAGGPGGTSVWTVASGAVRALGGDPVSRLLFSADGKLVVGVSGDRYLRIWEVASDGARVFAVESGTLTDVGAVRAGSAATASGDGTIRIWDLSSGRSRRAGAHAGGVSGLTLAEGGGAIASAGEDGTVRLWPDDLPEDPSDLRAFLQQSTDAQVGEGF